MKSASRFQRANWLSVCGLALVMFSNYALPVSAAVINQQPQSTNVLAGSNAGFTVGASGQTPLNFRWSFNGTNLTNGGRIEVGAAYGETWGAILHRTYATLQATPWKQRGKAVN